MPGPDTIDLAETFLDLAEGGAVHRHPGGDGFWRRLMAGEIALDRMMAVLEIGRTMAHWEMHPAGEEVIVALSGDADIVLDEPGGERAVTLAPGETFIVPRGAWHRFAVREPARLLFVTWGEGTEHRPMEVGEGDEEG